MSGIITEPIFLQTFPQMEPKNKQGAIQALVVAIYEIGCLIGAIGIIAFGDKLGRRRSILVGSTIMIIGAASSSRQLLLICQTLADLSSTFSSNIVIQPCTTDRGKNRDGRGQWHEYEHNSSVPVRDSTTEDSRVLGII